MDINEIYERVLITAPVDTNTFIIHLNTTIDELLNKYDDKYVLTPEAVSVHVTGMDDGLNVYDEYMTPITDNIIFLITGDGNRKTDYVAHAEYAKKRVWRKIHTERHLRREVW